MAQGEIFTTGVGVLDRAVAILDRVESRAMGTSELARELGLSVSTTHRLTGALLAHKLLRRDPGGDFHLGPRFTTAAIADTARPILEELQAATRESVQLWVRRADHRLCVLSVESDEELRAGLPVGAMIPLPQGSAARVLLGERDPGGAAWLESRAARAPGVGSVSAPVRLHGETVAAVCLSGPLHRLDPGPGLLFGARVAAAAQQVEAAVRAGDAAPAASAG
ncbi:IclR family transcriptional regulator [Murinocardiopsis flavida]|uniref:IclR family transcriptional regulator n=1 Tax=Murinocardiopsis flavida TaxID=645275 RepID=A0A2P8CXJ6_9ACTN|nr:helix-turn-helix domain-containing protein [Murinocardiopsis flavida]PSK89680.1 IclR family transcriptional regulator [Murinocardiopsis flavida]